MPVCHYTTPVGYKKFPSRQQSQSWPSCIQYINVRYEHSFLSLKAGTAVTGLQGWARPTCVLRTYKTQYNITSFMQCIITPASHADRRRHSNVGVLRGDVTTQPLFPAKSCSFNIVADYSLLA